MRVVQAGAIAVVLAALPYKTFDLDRYFVPKELVLGLAATAAALLLLAHRDAHKPTVDRVDLLLLLFLSLSGASGWFAINSWLAWRAFAISFLGVLLFWTTRGLARAGLGHHVLGAVALAVVIAAGTSLFQAYGGHSDLLSLNRAPGGTLGNRNFVAHLAAIGLPVLVLIILDTKRFFAFVAGTIGLCVVVWALILSRSRAAWLAAGICAALGLIAAIRSGYRPKIGRALVLGSAAVGGIVAALVLPNTLHWKSGHPYLESAVGVADYRDGSGHGRIVQYSTTTKIALAHPALGVGPGNWPVVYPKYAAPSDPSLDSDDGMTSNPWPSSDWAAFLSERGFAATICLALAFITLAASAGAPLTLLATVLAVFTVGAFDAVLLLPAPNLIVWCALGALSPPTTTGFRIPIPRAVVAVLIFVLGAAAVLRSTQEAVAMGIANDETSAAPLEIAARVDPGSYRIQVRVAEAEEHRGHCGATITHATAARKLFPSAPAPRHLLSRCR
ncbi:MAG TPA: O-antigen ligase family protein [Gemmatimonadaceae bacterium]|nr:O-antigen ligase family protein [Gemmatimonadaceae bacterium]